jgi:hypothetical protein
MVTSYKEAYGKAMKQKKGNKMRFTEATDPKRKEFFEFMVSDAIACPRYLPMDENDSKVTSSVMYAMLVNPDIPMSEYIRKEFYWNCVQGFREAMTAEPALIKEEVMKKMRHFDLLYNVVKSKEEHERDSIFKRGDYFRFSTVFYLMIR